MGKHRPKRNTSAKRNGKAATMKGSSRVVYKRNYLTQVLARLDFSTAYNILEGGPPKNVANVLKASFPIIEQKKQVQVQHFQVISGEAAKKPKDMLKDMQQSRRELFQWFFHSKDRNKNFHIAADCCYIEFKKYKHFEELRQDFLQVAEALFAELPTLRASRIGLRYIDTIALQEDQPTDWSKYLQPHLLGIFKNATDPATITRALGLLDFDYGDMQMRFQYGMPNPDFPATIRQKQFTLDYDAYSTGLFEFADVQTHLDKFHDKIIGSFEEVITDGLRAKMNSDG
jgi:uncharacterized protein (TIGR04255 family)